jgi:hypothetical protein
MTRRKKASSIIGVVLTGLWLVACVGAGQAAEKKGAAKDGPTAMTQADLQSEVMAFADRYFSIITSAFNAYEAQEPSAEKHKAIIGISTYSLSSAMTIAAQANPVGALLDMVGMVTLGRIIFEEDLFTKYGPQIKPMVAGFQEAERDIWEVASKALTPAQQQKLRALILDWRRQHPKIVFFPSVRFGDLSAHRMKASEKEARGLFKSVANASQQVEETRLLAERGIFLATRMPMLTGLFGGVWFSHLVKHPDMESVLEDVKRFSQVSERLAAVAEQLPEKIAVERDATIKQAMGDINELTMKSIDETAKRVSREREASITQLMQAVSNERKQILEDFVSEEPKVRGLLSELRTTLAESNKVMVSADALVKGLNLQPPEGQAAAPPGKPFDILEYQATLREATKTIVQVNEVMKTLDKMGLKSMLPQIIVALENLEKKGQAWVYLGFFLGIALILVFLVGSVIAALTYRHFATRIFGSGSASA